MPCLLSDARIMIPPTSDVIPQVKLESRVFPTSSLSAIVPVEHGVPVFVSITIKPSIFFAGLVLFGQRKIDQMNQPIPRVTTARSASNR